MEESLAHSSALKARDVRRIESWQDFDDWFWLSAHHEFQAQTFIVSPLASPALAQSSRLMSSVCLLAKIGIGLWLDPGCAIKYSFVGLLLTEVYFLAAFLNKQREPPLMETLDEEEQKAWNMREKYSVWQAWKWTIVFFELAFTSEILIACASFFITEPVEHRLNQHIDHIVPLLLLLFESLVSTSPVIKRHFSAILLCFFGYFIIVLLATKVEGFPIYELMDFSSIEGWLLPLAVLLLAVPATYFALFWANTKKLRKWGEYDLQTKRTVDLISESRQSYL